jgi:integrase
MQGHIHKRVHTCTDGRQTTRWYVVVDVDRASDGRRRQQWHGGFFSRREAEVARARLVNDLHNHRYVSPNRLKVASWVRESWLPMMETRVKPTTYRGYRQMMEDYLLPRLGDRPIQKLRTLELDQLYADMLRGEGFDRPLSVGTVANVHRAIHKALADTVDAGLAVDNPASRAKAPRPWRIRQIRVASWLPAELGIFLDATAADRFAAVWRLAAMTGMRRGEILGLRWEDVDLAGARLSVRRALVEVDYRVVESSTKGNAARTIDLDRRTVELLEKHRVTQEHERCEWGTDYERNDLVTAWQNGSPVHPQAFSRMFRTLVQKAGLRRIRLHDLRHTHATLSLQAGVPVTIVSERLGHHSPGFTLRQYAHALPGMQAAAAAIVAEIVEDECAGSGKAARCSHAGVTVPRPAGFESGSRYHDLISLFVSCLNETNAVDRSSVRG